MEKFNILCLGSQDMTPIKGNDCSHFLINGRILIDCGTSPVMNMLNLNVDLGYIDTIVFTHMHPDHCIGLASLLYYLGAVKKHDLTALKIYGPAETVANAVACAMKCYAPDIMPSVTELHGGETVLLGEGSQAVEMKTLRAAHAVPAVSLRMERQGVSVGFTGDTYPIKELILFFNGCDTLIHECSFGRLQPHETAEEVDILKRACGHSSAADAAKTADAAHVKNVCLVHTCLPKDDRVKQFSEISDIPARFLTCGDRVIID